MQYANIIVDHKAGYHPLTYAIPAPLLAHLAVGSVVIVPIGRQTVHGVVSQFVRRLDPAIAQKLKPIQGVIHEGAYVPEWVIAASQLLQTRYGYPLREVLFAFLPPFLKRKQPNRVPEIALASGYHLYAYSLALPNRAELYQKIATKLAQSNQSLLILEPSIRAAQGLAQALKGTPVVLFPSENSPKAHRDYASAALSPKTPAIFIGTRGAMITPLHQIGGVVIDEPWFPGHKEERSPRLWTPIAMQALCQKHDIPLYLVSSLPWPETQLLGQPEAYTVKSDFGEITLVPQRNLEETLVQFLGDYDTTGQNLAIIAREETRQIGWCSTCRYASSSSDMCQICGNPLTFLPRLAKDTIQDILERLRPQASLTLLGTDELVHYQHFDATLAVGFDVFLAITDYRAPNYLISLLYLLGSQARQTAFVTSYPDEWTQLLHKDVAHFLTTEIEDRKTHDLPPFSLPIQITSFDKAVIEKALTQKPDGIVRSNPIRRTQSGFACLTLFSLAHPVPEAWFRASNLKVDILPSYIE